MDIIFANDLKNGYTINFKKHPIKLVEYYSTKEGKHGSTKIHICGIDIITKKKYKHIYKGSDRIEIPEIKKFNATLIDPDNLSIMLPNGFTIENINIINDLKDEILQYFNEKLEKDEDCIVTITQCNQDYWITNM